MKNYKNFNSLNESIESIFAKINSVRNIDGLMELGVDINTKDEDGRTILYYLATSNEWGLVNHILNKYNPDINIKCNDKSLFYYAKSSIQKLLLDKSELELDDEDFIITIRMSDWDVIYRVLNKYDVDLELKIRNSTLIKRLMSDLDDDPDSKVLDLIKSKYKTSYDKYIRNKTVKKFKI